MNIYDIDLDISNLLGKLPEDHVMFYFRASADDSKDFAYIKGDGGDLAAALANIMSQSDTIASIIEGALGMYYDE